MNDEQLHKKLPIGQNEKIIKLIRHHWFAYASIYFITGVVCLLIIIGMIFAVVSQSSLGLSHDVVLGIIFGSIAFIILVIAFSSIPIWMKKQEALVLTEEALLQIEKPSIFSSKVSQLNLAHLTDVTVNQDALGSLFNFGRITIETPGEQDNYEFSTVGDPRVAAKCIIEAHENYAAALESGQIRTTLGERAPVPGAAWRQSPQLSSRPDGYSEGQTTPMPQGWVRNVPTDQMESPATTPQQPTESRSNPQNADSSIDPNDLKDY